jgi:hypothetical protein
MIQGLSTPSLQGQTAQTPGPIGLITNKIQLLRLLLPLNLLLFQPSNCSSADPMFLTVTYTIRVSITIVLLELHDTTPLLCSLYIQKNELSSQNRLANTAQVVQYFNFQARFA